MPGIKKRTAFFVFGVCLAVLSALLPVSSHASDLKTQESTLYPYRSMIEIQDDFLTGVNTNGTLGELGWNLIGGTNANRVSEANRPGIFRKDTSAVINTIAAIALYGSPNGFDPAPSHAILWVNRLNTNDVNTTVRIGAANSTSASPPIHGIYLEKLDGDTNWFCVTRDTSVETRVDSTVAVSTNFATFAYSRNSSGVQFSINNTNVCSVMTATIPTTFLNPLTQIVTSAAAAKTIDVDYFQLKLLGLTR